MTSNAVLQQFGVYIQPGFLSRDECRKLMDLVDSKESVAAGVYDDELGGRVDPEKRRVREIPAGGEEFQWVVERFEQCRGALSDHFSFPLGELEGPAYLRYEVGDFFLPHRDGGGSARTSGRQITAVLFLNAAGGAQQAGSYEGAELSLYGVMSFAGAENHGLPVQSEAGLLVAFPSGTKHGVSELLRGKRYCAVCWYR